MQRLRLNNFQRGCTITSSIRDRPSTTSSYTGKCIQIPRPQLNWDYLFNPVNTSHIRSNGTIRKTHANIDTVLRLHQQLRNSKHEKEREIINKELLEEALKIPNDTHPEPSEYGNEPKEIRSIGQCPVLPFPPQDFSVLAEKHHLLHNKRLTPFCGNKSYFLMDGLSELEHALVRFAINNLLNRGFQLISVPDILHHQIIESCGMNTRGPRSQVYRLDPEWHTPKAAEGELCLSGTAEMALGGCFMNQVWTESQLPLKVVSASRCYRAEIGINAHEKGIYRVHHFTKVEMFGISSKDESNTLLEEFVSIQEEMFSSLGLHLRTIDMPPCELGSPAYRKYDVEAWMPGHQMFGELSSSSNCTDYQSRRLNIRYISGNEMDLEFAHTVNGTACAIPRLIIALCETFQQADGTILIPEALQPYMKRKTVFDRNSVFRKVKNHAMLGELETRASQRVRMKKEQKKEA